LKKFDLLINQKFYNQFAHISYNHRIIMYVSTEAYFHNDSRKLHSLISKLL